MGRRTRARGARTIRDTKITEALMVVLDEPLLMCTAQLDRQAPAEDRCDIRECLAEHCEPKIDCATRGACACVGYVSTATIGHGSPE